MLWLHNLAQNICRLFHFLAQFLFTTSKAELDYYHQKINVRVTSQVAERFRKIPEIFGFDGEYPVVQPITKFWRFSVKNSKKSHVKHSIEKPFFLNFMNLSPTFCPRL